MVSTFCLSRFTLSSRLYLFLLWTILFCCLADIWLVWKEFGANYMLCHSMMCFYSPERWPLYHLLSQFLIGKKRSAKLWPRRSTFHMLSWWCCRLCKCTYSLYYCFVHVPQLERHLYAAECVFTLLNVFLRLYMFRFTNEIKTNRTQKYS